MPDRHFSGESPFSLCAKVRKEWERKMDQYLMEGRYYQFVGKIREWIGTVAHDELQANLGRHDQLVGRISEHCRLPLEEAELLASEVASR
jgi:uncharacterized protein YjbJ (UPF0337 family)